MVKGRGLGWEIKILYEIRASQGGEDIDVGILSCNTEDKGSMFCQNAGI
jgi:hypothetical protein